MSTPMTIFSKLFCQNNKLNAMTNSLLYEAPHAYIAEIGQDPLICASPGPGGTEDIYYENWNNQ